MSQQAASFTQKRKPYHEKCTLNKTKTNQLCFINYCLNHTMSFFSILNTLTMSRYKYIEKQKKINLPHLIKLIYKKNQNFKGNLIFLTVSQSLLVGFSFIDQTYTFNLSYGWSIYICLIYFFHSLLYIKVKVKKKYWVKQHDGRILICNGKNWSLDMLVFGQQS